jgi:hypothetical protein
MKEELIKFMQGLPIFVGGSGAGTGGTSLKF